MTTTTFSPLSISSLNEIAEMTFYDFHGGQKKVANFSHLLLVQKVSVSTGEAVEKHPIFVSAYEDTVFCINDMDKKSDGKVGISGWSIGGNIDTRERDMMTAVEHYNRTTPEQTMRSTYYRVLAVVDTATATPHVVSGSQYSDEEILTILKA